MLIFQGGFTSVFQTCIYHGLHISYQSLFLCVMSTLYLPETRALFLYFYLLLACRNVIDFHVLFCICLLCWNFLIVLIALWLILLGFLGILMYHLQIIVLFSSCSFLFLMQHGLALPIRHEIPEGWWHLCFVLDLNQMFNTSTMQALFKAMLFLGV
jgi:hypothetical protein